MVRRRVMLVTTVVVTSASLTWLPDASAAIPVTTTADGGPGSLRQAVTTANGNGQDDEIVLQAAAEYQLTLCGGVGEEDANADGDLDHTAGSALTITGNGATIRNTCSDERVMEQLGSGPLTLLNLTITGGSSLGSGGGVNATTADIAVTDSTFTNNTADTGGGIYAPSGDIAIVSSTLSGNRSTAGSGGAVYGSAGTFTVVGSAFSGNVAGDDGGALRTSAGAVTITGSTFAGNTATAEGGVLRTSGGEVTATNSTFSGNTAGTYGGGFFDGSGSISLNNATLIGNDATTYGDALGLGLTGTAQFANTILSGPGDDCGGPGTFASNGNNIGSDTSCNLTGTGDKPNTDPKLGALADNGGPTQTHALLPGSPAIDAGNPAPPGSGGAACEAVDQRGLPRNCDIGAYELVLCATVPVNRIGTTGKDTLTGTPGADGLLGSQGNDRLAGKAGKDGLCGGPGRDTLKGGGGKDRLDGGPGKDLCVGQAGRDKAKGCEREKGIP